MTNHNHERLDDFSLSGKKIFWVTILNVTITVAEVLEEYSQEA